MYKQMSFFSSFLQQLAQASESNTLLWYLCRCTNNSSLCCLQLIPINCIYMCKHADKFVYNNLCTILFVWNHFTRHFLKWKITTGRLKFGKFMVHMMLITQHVYVINKIQKFKGNVVAMTEHSKVFNHSSIPHTIRITIPVFVSCQRMDCYSGHSKIFLAYKI